MPNVQTNFRAQDMPGGRSRGRQEVGSPSEAEPPADQASSPSPAPEPTATSSAAPEAQAEADSDQEADPEQQPAEVPRGRPRQILSWVGDDPDRAREALATERQHDSPRRSVVQPLQRIIEEGGSKE